MALSWLRGGKVDHPMADARRARQIVEELPAQDAVRALGEITEWLESMSAIDGFRADRRFENVDLLDAAAKGHQRRILQDYLAMPRQQTFQENRLHAAASAFWRQLGDAYLLCARQHEQNAAGASAIRRHMPAIVARAVRALAFQLKWTLLRYGAVEARVWAELAQLCALAEQRGWAEGSVAIYPGAHGSSSVRQELLRALMFSASCPDGLAPVRQEIAERVVAHFSGLFTLSAREESCTHAFDLSAPRAPVRMTHGVVASPGLRFFGAGSAAQALAAFGAQLESGGLPKDVNLGGSYDSHDIAAVLRHLALHWSPTPPARASERRDIAGRLTVVAGLAEIMNVLDPAASDELDFSREEAAPAAESWIMINVSDGGYGAIIPARKSDWVKVGTLVGLRGDISPHWGVGVIRRITRDEHQQRKVGIQLLTRAAIPIRVSRPGGAEPQPAVLLSTSADRQGEVGVVLREGFYNGRDSLDMSVRDKGYLLMPARKVEDGEDYDWAKFKVMQRSA